MSNIRKLNHIITGVLLVISTAFQLLALLAGVLLNTNSDLMTKTPWLASVWGVMLVLLIAVYVLTVTLGDKYPWPPIILVGALVGTLMALMVAFALRNAFPDHLNATGATQGLTTWKLLYRHVSSALVGLLLAIEAGIQWFRFARERRKAVAEAIDSAESTIGLDFFAGDETAAKPKKLKRSLRRAKQDAQTPDSAE